MEESNMVIEKVRSRLDNLSKLAPQLNKATDLYMGELKEIEEELNKLNLGTEIELNKWIKTDNPKSEYNDFGEPSGVFYSAWTLGYGKYRRGDWCIFIREYQGPQAPAGLSPVPTDIVEEKTTPLLEASRDLRIAAAEHIPDLLKTIEDAVKGKIETLGKVSDKR